MRAEFGTVGFLFFKKMIVTENDRKGYIILLEGNNLRAYYTLVCQLVLVGLP